MKIHANLKAGNVEGVDSNSWRACMQVMMMKVVMMKAWEGGGNKHMTSMWCLFNLCFTVFGYLCFTIVSLIIYDLLC